MGLVGLADWDTGNVTNMSDMFLNCAKLTNTVGINSWDISKVTTFAGMFGSCPSHPEFTKGLVPGIAVHLNQQPNQSTSTILRPITAGFVLPNFHGVCEINGKFVPFSNTLV